MDGGAGRAGAMVHMAVVHAGGAICHLCAAPSADRLAVRLGEYVRSQAPYQLWPSEAERVASLLEEGRAQDAVDLYFSAPGQRWDRERLVVRKVAL